MVSLDMHVSETYRGEKIKDRLINYAYDMFIFAGLVIATLTFFIVAKNVIGSYSEVSSGKGTWGAVGLHAGIGVLLLVLIVFMLTEAADIL